MKTKLFSLFFALIVGVGTMLATEVGGIWYNLDSSTKTAEVTFQGSYYSSYSDEYTGSVDIPSSVTWASVVYTVTSIGKDAFRDCTSLTSVVVPNSVTSIGSSAFYGCSGLTSVTIPNSVTSIGSAAFLYCSGLTSVTIPNSVTSIGSDAFYGCSGLTSVMLGSSVTSISSGAFYKCTSLTSIIIPNSVTSIGNSAFMNCISLTDIEIPNSVTSIESYAFNGCTGLTSVTIPNSVTSIGDQAFWGCSGLTSVTIGNSVTSIGSSAFSSCSGLTSIVVENGNTKYDSRNNCNAIIETSSNTLVIGCKSTIIPSNVISIGDNAFSRCPGLTSVVIPNGVTSIGADAFYGCSGLTNVEIPNGVTSIGSSAFYGCSGLTSVTIPNSVTSIGNSAFYGCSGLISIIIPNGVTIINIETFYGCSSLMNVTIGNSVTSIGKFAFSGCSGLTSITIPGSVSSIGAGAFGGCSSLASVTINSDDMAGKAYTSSSNLKNIFGKQVTEYIIGESVTSIGDYAFNGCSGLTNVTIGNSVTSIGNFAFSDCTGLTNVEISDNVNSIGDCTFYNCSNLTSVTIGKSVISIVENNAFYGCNNITSVVWNAKKGPSCYFGSQIESFVFGEEVEIIPANCCSGMNKLTSITIPNNVTSIGRSAFSGCSGLTSVTIPNSVTSIGSSAFSSCSGLTSIVVENGNTKYDSRNNCNAIIETSSNTLVIGCKSTIIPSNVISIGDNAFSRCPGLTSVVIPNGVTSIGGMAFGNCSDLTSVTIPNSVTSIGNYAFWNCAGLTSVTIPNSVTSIGDYAFDNCSGLTSVTIGNSVTSIGNYAFSDCNNINSVVWNAKKGPSYNFGGQIESFVFGEEVEIIPRKCCYGMSKLQSITIPRSVTSIEYSAFKGCIGLTSICFKSITPPSLAPDTVFPYNSGMRMFVPCEAYDEYATSWTWGPYAFASYLKREHNPFVIVVNTNDIYAGNVDYPQSSCNEANMFASASVGHHFVRWNDGNIDNPRIVTLTSDTTFTAFFSVNEYSINVNNEGPCGHINGESGIFNYMTMHTYEAVPNYGYHFIRWNDGVTDNPRTITLTQDTIFTAEFAKNNYTIYVQSDEEQGIIKGSGTFEYLDMKQIEAIPNYGYYFTQWSDGNKDNPRIIELTKDTTFTAKFAKNTYSVTTESSNTERGTTIGDSVALYLDEMQISASANYGYHFSQWSDGNADNPRTITLTQDTTFTAEFAKNNYSIYVQADELQGTIHGGGTFEYLDLKQIEAIPNYGYHFVQWSDGIIDNPRTIELTKDTTFTATFAVDVTGVCGDDNLLTWAFDADSKTLTIYGDGQLNSNYTYGVQAPEQTERLIIEKGITSIGNAAFEGMCSTIATLVLPSTVTSIGDYAFAGMSNRQFKTLALPNTIKYIGAYAFDGAAYLQTIHFGSTLEEIGAYAFNGCTRVKEMTCLAEITPNVGQDGLTSISSLAELHVPADYLTEYQLDNNWNRFLVKPMGTSETTTEEDKVIVVTDDNTATFTWPTNQNAASYTIQITKDGEIFCTLVFNANGQLTGIAFAPSRDNSQQTQAATMEQNAAQFTVTGLSTASKYSYHLEVTNASKVEMVSYSGEFATTGYVGEVNKGGEPEYNPEGIEDVNVNANGSCKILHEGQIYILRGEKVYTVTGQEVK